MEIASFSQFKAKIDSKNMLRSPIRSGGLKHSNAEKWNYNAVGNSVAPQGSPLNSL